MRVARRLASASRLNGVQLKTQVRLRLTMQPWHAFARHGLTYHKRRSYKSGLLPRSAVDDALLDVGLEDAEGLLVSLDRHVQGLQHALGGVIIGDDPLLDFDRLGRHAEGLGIESEVQD